MKAMEDDFAHTKLNQITLTEFNSRVKDGEKLVLLDDMVIELSRFAYSHPGGAFLIDFHIGSDISKFFYGAYAFDQNGNIPGDNNVQHAHSNVARKIANRHAIGVLSRPASQESDSRFAVDHAGDFPLNTDITSF